MNANEARGRLVMVKRSAIVDHKESICDYVRRTCLLVAEHIEDYVTDGVYTECPGEVVIHLPLDGAASIEVSTETFVLEDE